MGVLLFKGGVGVGMLKWQTSDLPRGRGRNHDSLPARGGLVWGLDAQISLHRHL
jgi:hypothetical protein